MIVRALDNGPVGKLILILDIEQGVVGREVCGRTHKPFVAKFLSAVFLYIYLLVRSRGNNEKANSDLEIGS